MSVNLSYMLVQLNNAYAYSFTFIYLIPCPELRGNAPLIYALIITYFITINEKFNLNSLCNIRLFSTNTQSITESEEEENHTPEQALGSGRVESWSSVQASASSLQVTSASSSLPSSSDTRALLPLTRSVTSVSISDTDSFFIDTHPPADAAVVLCQTVIDGNERQVASKLQDDNVKFYICKHIPKVSLKNHRLPTKIEWTTAMCQACFYSPVRIMQVLLEAGASLYNVNSLGHTALMAACSSNVDVMSKVTFLIEYNEHLVTAVSSTSFTSLHTAAQRGLEEVCAILVEHGADIHARTSKGSTSLHLAAMYNQAKVMQLLLQHGAEIDARSNDKAMPVHIAAWFGAREALRFLLDNGVNVHVGGQWNRSPLHYAAAGGQVSCVTELMQRGAQVHRQDERGMSHFGRL